MVLTLIMFGIGGALIGIIHGSLLTLFERRTFRRIRPIITLGITLIISLIINYLILKPQFERQQLDMMLYPEAIAVVVGLIVSVITSETSPMVSAE